MLAAEVARLGPEDFVTFVAALPLVTLAVLRHVVKQRVWAERWRQLPAPAPVVVTPAADPEEILTADEAAHALRISLDTLYARVHRGELEAEPRVAGGRLKFRRANLRLVAPSVDRRYAPPHDGAGRENPPHAARVDATRARGGPQRNGDDRRPLGARRARRHTTRRNEPWAPGQGKWYDPQGDPRPKGGGA